MKCSLNLRKGIINHGIKKVGLVTTPVNSPCAANSK